MKSVKVKERAKVVREVVEFIPSRSSARRWVEEQTRGVRR
jgi:N-glycosylase/DNA lyase